MKTASLYLYVSSLVCGMAFLSATVHGADKEKRNAKSDEKFVMHASQSGMKEVELSKQAAEKATSPEVKKFAAMMVSDHTKANEELKAVASKKSFPMATTLDEKHQSQMNAVAEKTGAEFDKEYMEEMVKDHKKAVEMFEDASKGAEDADLKAFAAKTLPTLQHHLSEAQALQKKMSGS